jgi:hypothetical protein
VDAGGEVVEVHVRWLSNVHSDYGSFSVGEQVEPAVGYVLSAACHIEAMVNPMLPAYTGSFSSKDWTPQGQLFADSGGNPSLDVPS